MSRGFCKKERSLFDETKRLKQQKACSGQKDSLLKKLGGKRAMMISSIILGPPKFKTLL